MPSALPPMVKDAGHRSDVYLKILEAVVANKTSITLNNGESLSLEASFELLPDTEIGPIFLELTSNLRISMGEQTSVLEADKLRHRFRKLFGVRYSSLMLTSPDFIRADIESHASAAALIARAIVDESLQWHAEGVLSHVLIYYTDGESEDLLHEGAVVNPAQSGADLFSSSLNDFRRSLIDYVANFGSSVRTKEHLRLASLSPRRSSRILRTDALLQPRETCAFSDHLYLPAGPMRVEGNQDRYRKLVLESLGRPLRLRKDFDVLHYSAGSDSVGNAGIRATAHLYVIFTKPMSESIAVDYNFAMRESLSRLTSSFTLDRMQGAYKKLDLMRKIEEAQHKEFEKQVQKLSYSIQVTQTMAEKVIAMVTPSVWASILNWIPIIDKLSSDAMKREEIKIGDRVKTSSSHDWGSEQWCMALLKLVNATEEDFPQGVKRASDGWRAISASVKTDYQDGARIHPIWRCLHRMQIPMLGELHEGKFHESWVNEKQLRECFVAPDQGVSIFNDNGFTGLFLILALGVRCEPEHELVYEQRFSLDYSLKANHVIDGLNFFYDLIHRADPADSKSISVAVVSNKEADHLCVRIEYPQLSRNFGRVCTTMGQIIDSHRHQHPGLRRRTTSMAIFSALGIDDISWQAAITTVIIDGNAGRVVRHDDRGSQLAMCESDDRSISFTYRLRG